MNPDVYDEDDYEEMRAMLPCLTEEICIDRSYVKYPKTKYKRTFIENNGWKYLCKLIIDSDFGRKLTYAQAKYLIEAEQEMILCYLYECYEQFGYDTSYMFLEFDDMYQFKFMARYEYDNMQSWRDYQRNKYIPRK